MRLDRPTRLLAATALLLAAGCGAETTTVESAAPDGTRTANGLVKCPDPSSCTLSNGIGVYYAEDGFAGLDDKLMLLITHFDNHEKDVTFEGRYFDSDLGQWKNLPTSGLVDAGIYGNVEWNVIAVHVDAAWASFTLQSRKDPSITVEVKQKDLRNLTLRLRIENPMLRGKLAFYLLQFTAITVENHVVSYMPEWRPDSFGTKWKPYCLDPKGNPDNASFQEAIQVDPVDGTINYGGDAPYSVTFSCRLGAPVTCQEWGYDPMKYQWHFPSCIHMKRASYCGDQNAFTYSGTKLVVADSEGVWTDKIDKTNVEAEWSPKGAVCVTAPRHPMLGYNFMCNGSPMPKCPDPLISGNIDYLISGNP